VASRFPTRCRSSPWRSSRSRSPPAPLGDVLDREQERGGVVVGVEQPAGVEEHGAPAEAGEVVLDLVALDRHAPRDDLLEQVAQVGDVPLAVAELVEVAAEGVVAADPEGLVERAAGADDAQVAVEHEQGVADGVDDALRLDVAGAQEAVEVFQVHRSASRPVLVIPASLVGLHRPDPLVTTGRQARRHLRRAELVSETLKAGDGSTEPYLSVAQ
jgi:hypothetical protein